MKSKINAFMKEIEERNGHESEFMQAVQEVAETVIPYIVSQDIYHGKNVLMRMVEPERAITFRVAWVNATTATTTKNKATSSSTNTKAPLIPRVTTSLTR